MHREALQSTPRPAVSSPPFNRRWSLALPLLALALALGLTLTDCNIATFRALQSVSMEWPNLVWHVITWLGDTQLCLALLATAALPRHPRWLMAMVWAALPATLFVHGIKASLPTARPLGVLGSDGVHVIGAALYHGSFPSGHTATAFVVAGCVVLSLAPAQRARWALPVIALATLVGLSRIAVGAHWPVDVLVGAAGGWACAALGVWTAGRWPVGQTGRGLRVLGVLAIALGVSLWLRPLAEPEAWLARLLGTGAVIAGALAWHRPRLREVQA